MVDNVAITAGAGTTVATDDVGGVHYQKVKLAIGAADTANLIAVGSGAIDTGTPRVTLATDSPGVVASVESTMPASITPVTTGGCSVFKSLDLDETEEDVKTSAGQVYWIYAINRTTSPLYLRLYNATAANVTVGTTAHLLGPIEIPANASDHTAMFLQFQQGVAFSTAVSAAVTTGIADNDTGAPGANHCLVNIGYK
jgi:hypothetical protein